MRNLLSIAALLWLLLARCARDTVIELPEDTPKVVAVCHFTEGQNFRVKVSISKSVNDEGKPVLPSEVDATLSINGSFWDRLQPDTTDRESITYWESNYEKFAQANTSYALSVRVPGYPPVQSQSKIPAHLRPEHIVINKDDLIIESLPNGQSELRIPLAIHLPASAPTENLFFAFNLTHETDIYETFVPPVINYTEESRTNFLADGRTFSLLHDIPEPVVLVNANYWVDSRRTLHLTARIPFDRETERPHFIFLEWRTLSEQFYRYHLSLSRQGGDLPLSEPDAVFNNITGGYGNFSGYSVSVDTIEIPNF